MSPGRFCDISFKKVSTSNQLDFKPNFITKNLCKFEAAKVRRSSLILRFTEVIFRNLGIFWPIFNLNDVTRRF